MALERETAGDGRYHGMVATREELHRDVDALSEPQVPKARIVVVEDDGPEPTIAEVRERLGTRPMTPAESTEFWREHEPHMVPPTAVARDRHAAGTLWCGSTATPQTRKRCWEGGDRAGDRRAAK